MPAVVLQTACVLSCNVISQIKLHWLLSVFPSSAVFVQFYLIYSKLSINSIILHEVLIPVAFEVDGIDQHQLGHVVHHAQQVLDFTWWTVKMKLSSAFRQTEAMIPSKIQDFSLHFSLGALEITQRSIQNQKELKGK